MVQGDKFVLITKKELAALDEIRQAAYIALTIHAHGTRDQMNTMMVGLEKACERYDKLKEER